MASCASTSPMFYKPYRDRYVDGGVMANNPCEYAMTEISQYDAAMGITQRNFSVAVSLGTGIADWDMKTKDFSSLSKNIEVLVGLNMNSVSW